MVFSVVKYSFEMCGQSCSRGEDLRRDIGLPFGSQLKQVKMQKYENNGVQDKKAVVVVTKFVAKIKIFSGEKVIVWGQVGRWCQKKNAVLT